jgi:hypothetical protein
MPLPKWMFFPVKIAVPIIAMNYLGLLPYSYRGDEEKGVNIAKQVRI